MSKTTEEQTVSELVKEARELLAMATPGPWQVYADGDGYCVGRDTGNTLAYGAAITGWGNVRQTKPDAELIARAPELISSLCNEADRLSAQVSNQAESIKTFQSQQREMKEAIHSLINTAEFALSTPGFVRGRDALKNAIESGRSAITPKGSKQ